MNYRRLVATLGAIGGTRRLARSQGEGCAALGSEVNRLHDAPAGHVANGWFQSFEGEAMKRLSIVSFLVAVAVAPTAAQEASAADFHLTVTVGWRYFIFYQSAYCEARTFHTSAKRRRFKVEKIGCRVSEMSTTPSFYGEDEEYDADYVRVRVGREGSTPGAPHESQAARTA